MTLENNALTPSQDATRNAILDASRDLFARFGYKKTTMEDIAMALRKGKSSLYYYFKNKEEIFQAVIETESDTLFTRLQEVVRSDRDPKTKLRDYVIIRMETISGLENYQKVMKESLYEGYEYLESIKRKGELLEEDLLLSIINEGIMSEVFQIKNPKMGAIGIATALRGLEIPLFKGDTKREDLNEQLENILNILFYGVIKR
ncbi:TetR/AcrR family transcriptional regulator [Alkalitalea saponilacus]|uniref:Transcriptional regulator, TetR family n=1 Tax=Alkalitalea saponilacus TaxID=889453 RepID=A0A1T5FQD6_9BACT|nr:TetR/AcrR family transcriptional regulator [Alkalitalea saponilacus]ASB49464.1 TetR family transcriptional regulator [Alkalitalea saponilacus]SKB98398.1 transcriptional regulator, TetR family [Alkalitalea saponilacus]